MTSRFAKYNYDTWVEKIFIVTCPLFTIVGGVGCASSKSNATFEDTMLGAVVGTSVGMGASILTSFFHPLILVGGCIGVPVYVFRQITDSPPVNINTSRVKSSYGESTDERRMR